HWAGEVTCWCSKCELIILLGIVAFLVLFLLIFERFPEIYNYPKRFNQSNAKDFYLTGRKLVNQAKNIMIVIFSLLLYANVSVALGWSNGLGIAFLPIVIIVLAIPILTGIIQF